MSAEDVQTACEMPDSQPAIPKIAAINSRLTIPHLRWHMAGLLLASTLLSYLDRQTMSVAGPYIRDELHLSNSDYAGIVGAFLLAYAFAQPLAGCIMDRLGTHLGFALAVGWWSLATAAHGFARSVFVFSGLRAMLAIGEAANFPAAARVVSSWFPARERTVATGVYNTGAGLGAIVAPPLIGWLIARHGWPWAFYLTGAAGLLWIAWWVVVFREPEAHAWLGTKELEHIRSGSEPGSIGGDSVDGRPAWRQVAARREFWGLALAQFFTGPIWWFYVFWIPDYLKNARGLDLAHVALIAALPFVAADLGSLTGGFVPALLIRKGMSVLRARKTAMCASAVITPLAAFAVQCRSTSWAVLLICVATASLQFWSASALTLPADLFSQRIVGTAFGMMAFFTSMGGFLFTRVVGHLLDHGGYSTVFLLVAVMHPVAAVILVALLRSNHSPKHPPVKESF